MKLFYAGNTDSFAFSATNSSQMGHLKYTGVSEMAQKVTEKKSTNQNREHNISFEHFLGYLRDPRVGYIVAAVSRTIFAIIGKLAVTNG